MDRVVNISDEPIQDHHILIDGVLVDIQLRFMPTIQCWFMSIKVGEYIMNGVKMSGSTLHIDYMNLPFDFLVIVTDESKLDPFRIDDFVTGRCELYVVTAEEMAQVRGGQVPPLE